MLYRKTITFHTTAMEILHIEQGSPEWLRARLGKVTGTRLKSVMGSPAVQMTLIYELVAEQISGQAEELFTTGAMRWGTEHEADAVLAYERKFNARTELVGFCISDEFPFLGLSPDRLIKKGSKYVKGIEVKAPTTKTVVKCLLDGGIPDEYKWQVVNYFLVCSTLKELDFLIYDPRIINTERQLTVINVTRKDVQKDIDAAKKQLVDFRDKWRKVYEAVTK